MRALVIVTSLSFADEISPDFTEWDSDALKLDVANVIRQHFEDEGAVIERLQVGLGEPMTEEDLQDEIAKGAAAALAPPQTPTDSTEECDHLWIAGHTHCQRGCGMTWYAWRQQQREAGL